MGLRDGQREENRQCEMSKINSQHPQQTELPETVVGTKGCRRKPAWKALPWTMTRDHTLPPVTSNLIETR